MLDTFGFPTPQGANYQEFYANDGLTADWVKPRGASMVRFLLIGAGGGGAGAANGGGGGSGNVTQWIGPAIFIPDVLRVYAGFGGAGGTPGNDGIDGNPALVQFQQKNTTGYNVLAASGGGGGKIDGTSGAGRTPNANNYFGSSGIYRSLSGQGGGSSSIPSVVASTSTFLSGGAGCINTAGGNVDSKYGYPLVKGGGTDTVPLKGADGYFMTQPIIFGMGGAGGGYGTVATGGIGGNGGNGGIGCGGGAGGKGDSVGGNGGRGGGGAVFIWSW